MSSTTDAAEEAGTGRRRALLIGVGRTPFLERDEVLSRRFKPLDFVDRDIEMVRAALIESDYEVDALHPGHPDPERQDPDAGSIVVAVEKFLLSCEAGDTAFLYFSCHGVTVGEREYLLTSAAQARANGSLISHTILEVSPEVLLGAVPDGVTVVVCLDTCRTDDSRSPADFHETPLASSAYRDVAWLHASGRGQPAYADPRKGSYFGIALSQALSRTSAPTTFKEVHSYVEGRVEHLTAHLPGLSPTVEFRCAKDLEDRLVLCRGSRQTERWAKAITDSVLWKHTSHGPEAHQRVKDELEDLAREVAKSRLGTDAALTGPWSDPDYPIRVVDRLGRLVADAHLGDNERLSPAETAALLAAPLMHEGVVAVALSELAWLRPDRLDKPDEGGRGKEPAEGHQRQVCDEAADLCQAHSGVHHAAESLRQRKLTDAATAADHWLRHRFIADWDRLWDRTDDYPSVNGLLDRVVGAVSAGAEHMSGAQLVEVDRHVRRVLPHMTVPPGSSPRIDASASPSWSRLERPVPGNSWRAWELAYLLWLAALLAADPRRMSSVLVDHLGARRPLTPAAVVTALADSGWEALDRDGSTGYVLRLACPHPALHAALEELAATADASVRALHRRWHADGRTAPDLLRGVPRKVTTDLLKPADQSYTAPLERFRLAEDEIRPLLMGTQLYGDRTLAVRELYQNALDACRHRRQRAEYGNRRRRFNGPDREPEIHFLQAYDGDRPYIECRDEGSGMSREKLTSMFARAGKRYAQDPDYVQERRNWRRVGMEPIPLNSRFGIGVFSYFMLADEVTVHTEAIDEYGNPSRAADPLRATVQSGSGLLQIGPANGPTGRGGTVVRLYLNHEGDEEDPPSVVTTLRRLLWVSDFRVTAVELGPDGTEIRSDTWDPGVLHPSADRAAEWHGPAVKAGGESWIVQGPGQLLLDGIVVERAPSVFGYVFNLREKHRPEPSVNRNSLVSYDSAAVAEELLGAVPVAAGVLDEVHLSWLWELASEEPQLVVQLFDHLPPGATGLLDGETVDYQLPATRLPLRRTGVLGMDFTQMRQWTGREPMPMSERAEAKVLRRWRLTALGASSRGEPAFAPDRYPVPIGLDALLVSSRLLDGRWTVPVRAALRAGIPLAASVRALRRYAIAGAHVPAARSIADLRAVGAPGEEMADLCQAYEAAAARAAAGERPATSHVPLLTVAAQHGVPPSRLLPDLDVLRRLGVEIPDPDVLSAVDLTAKPFEAESALLEGPGGPWGEGQRRTVHPVDLLLYAPLPAQRRRLAERITALEPLGLSLTEPARDETLDHPALTPFERRLVSRDIDGIHPWLPAGRLTVQQLMERSHSLSQPLGEVAREVARIAPATGVSVPEVPEECRGWVPPRWVARATRAAAPTSGAGATHSSWRLLALAHQADRRPSPEELRRELVLLDSWGCLADPVDTLVEEFEHLSPALVALLEYGLSNWSDDVDRWGFDAGTLGIPLFLKFAAMNRSALGDAVLDVMRERRDGPRLLLELPVVPEEARSLTPVNAELALLLHKNEHGESFREHLAIQDLLSLAMTRRGGTLRHAATVLDSYRCLGGPTAPGQITDALAAFEPTDFDLAAFDPSLLGPGVLGPLELVLVAGRFGWTLGETYDRYVPFTSLGLKVTTPEPQGDERGIVPGWRDVIVLTEQLTGRAPSVAGTVTDEHVVLCAEETEQSEDDVRDSLRSYARLFSLVVPTPGGPQA
ncbi:caspase family protein [Streptomyces sp. TX20-6-3]|uniref:HD domain-containing protein n=1 Tax=Streptomyces sp. TX20-6-3 TaxID=3028705 RepID=UPI0029A61636|nr:caspase family protein [Streptomyces sp. TX20-6-3]MDX2558268.1 caspase family protein [Streptomyces sp. TX20-6-3]